jgi:hypothetical protein
MFSCVVQTGSFEPPPRPNGTPRTIPPPTPIRFPQCAPQTGNSPPSIRKKLPLVALLQSIHRPADIKLSHFEALGLHVISDASAQDIIPDASYLPPVNDWNALHADDLLEINEATRKPLNNGNYSPGVQTYRERQKELLIDNTAAFRTIRRIPPPTGQVAARLGNAYEFFKNLEFFSGYWPDTSLPPTPEPSAEDATPSIEDVGKEKEEKPPLHMQTHVRAGTGSQLPQDYRQHLLSAFIKLVAYDFGCNVSFPRNEPRLHLTPPPASPKSPPSYFNSSATFIFRTPTDRPSARSGIVEGPVAALSSRASTVFSTEAEEHLDFAREIVAILLTAQQRARDGKTEKRFGEGKWWTTVPRWGGGPGGPIGRESDAKVDELPEKITDGESAAVAEKLSSVTAEAKRAIGGISGLSPNKRSKKGAANGNMHIYENYRRMNPPGPTWDRKARYSAIGKSTTEKGFDDIFLVSALNHHISIVRTRVPERLLAVLEGGEGEEGWEKVVLWRSKWFDMYKGDERVEAMGLVWGMMAYLMRKAEVAEIIEQAGETDGGAEKMDLS